MSKPAEPADNAEKIVKEFVGAVTRPDLDPRVLQRRLDDLARLGAREVSATTLMTERVIGRTSGAEQAVIDKLAELREEVNPESGRRRVQRVRELVNELQDARSRLQQENAGIDQDRRALAVQTQMLARYVQLTERIASELGSRPAPSDVVDAVQHRRGALASHLEVARQADAALELIETHNRKLIEAVDTVSTTDAAVHAAAAVPQALRRVQQEPPA